jgi:hypothetical protein
MRRRSGLSGQTNTVRVWRIYTPRKTSLSVAQQARQPKPPSAASAKAAEEGDQTDAERKKETPPVFSAASLGSHISGGWERPVRRMIVTVAALSLHVAATNLYNAAAHAARRRWPAR